MLKNPKLHLLILPVIVSGFFLQAQTSFKLKYNNSSIYGGIEVGSKGVKLSVIEIGKNAQSRGAFHARLAGHARHQRVANRAGQARILFAPAAVE